jgi:hypothetical protein
VGGTQVAEVAVEEGLMGSDEKDAQNDTLPSQKMHSILNIWIRAITQPEPATYEALLQEMSNPSQYDGIVWVALAAFVSGVIRLFPILTDNVNRHGFSGAVLGIWICGIIALPVLASFGFAISSAVMAITADLFDGQGDIDSQSYVMAAVVAPMTIVSTVLRQMPVVGGALNSLAGFYTLWLGIAALQAVHRYSWGKAVLTAFSPIFIAVILGLCVAQIL